MGANGGTGFGFLVLAVVGGRQSSVIKWGRGVCGWVQSSVRKAWGGVSCHAGGGAWGRRRSSVGNRGVRGWGVFAFNCRNAWCCWV